MTDGALSTNTGASFGGTATQGQDYDGPSVTDMGMREVVFEVRLLNPGRLSEGATYTITDDSAAEPAETITLAVPMFGYTGSDTITRGDPITITILANDGYVAPVATPGPGPSPGPVTDNPTARGERLDAPATAAARGVGQLAARAVSQRLTAGAAGNANALTIAGRGIADSEIIAAEMLAGGFDGDASADELLQRSGFNLAGGSSGRGFNFWGSGGYVSAEGDHDGVDYDGDTSAFTLGIDTGWRNGLIGVAVSRSDGDTDFTVEADGMKSTLETTVTSVHPYLIRRFNRSQFYLTAGHGSGDAELKEPDTVIKTDLTVTTAAFGITHAQDDQLSAGVSALYTRAKLDAAQSAGRALPATTADSLRIAASAQARWSRGAWSPFADFTVRHDSGDGDTGIAGDLGGGIEFRAPAIHIRLAAATTIAADSAEEHRATLVIRKSTGDFDLSLNLAADGSGLDTARLLHGEWRF